MYYYITTELILFYPALCEDCRFLWLIFHQKKYRRSVNPPDTPTCLMAIYKVGGKYNVSGSLIIVLWGFTDGLALT